MVLYDWQRGRIPWFVLPPGAAPMENEESNANEDEEGLEVDPINEEEQDEDDPEVGNVPFLSERLNAEFNRIFHYCRILWCVCVYVWVGESMHM